MCLIPTSAHGTNPASANMAGFNVEYINTDKVGGIDLDDLKKKVVYISGNSLSYLAYYCYIKLDVFLDFITWFTESPTINFILPFKAPPSTSFCHFKS